MAWIDSAKGVRDVLVYAHPDGASDVQRAAVYLPPCRFADSPEENKVDIQDMRYLYTGADMLICLENMGSQVDRSAATSSHRHFQHRIRMKIFMRDIKDERRLQNVNEVPYEIARRLLAFPSLKGSGLHARYGDAIAPTEWVDTDRDGVPDTLVSSLTPQQIEQGYGTHRNNYTFEMLVLGWGEAETDMIANEISCDIVDMDVVVTEEILMDAGTGASLYIGGIDVDGIAQPLPATISSGFSSGVR